MPLPRALPAALAAAALVVACGDAGSGRDAEAPAARSAAAESALTPDELEKGVGPVRSVTLGSMDPTLAAEGEEVFLYKCSACHKLTERYVGPPIGDVLDRRTPEFVMNMMLNPEEMTRRHPEVRRMLEEYLTPMPNQQLTHEEARAVLEYLRTLNAGGPGS